MVFPALCRICRPSAASGCFDRSWYNRAGIERVMRFCSADQLADVLAQGAPIRRHAGADGVHLFKFFLERFHRRRHDPPRCWKIMEIDLAAMAKWDDYSKAKEDMFRITHTAASPWTVSRANDKRRTRLQAIGSVLYALDYDGKPRGARWSPSPTHRSLVRVPIISAAWARPDGHLAAKASPEKRRGAPYRLDAGCRIFLVALANPAAPQAHGGARKAAVRPRHGMICLAL